MTVSKLVIRVKASQKPFFLPVIVGTYGSLWFSLHCRSKACNVLDNSPGLVFPGLLDGAPPDPRRDRLEGDQQEERVRRRLLAGVPELISLVGARQRHHRL